LALSGSDEAVREAEAVVAAARRLGDGWGEAIARLSVAWGSAIAGRPVPELDSLVALLRSLDAGTLEAWARGLMALAAAEAGDPEAREAAAAAEAAARSMGVPVAELSANLAFAFASPSPTDAEEYRAAASVIARETGLLPPRLGSGAGPTGGHAGAGNGHATHGSSQAHAHAHTSNGAGQPNGVLPTDVRIPPRNGAGAPPIAIRLLGGFELQVGGRAVDLSSIRPRARALLRLLALHAGTPVHHESIESAMWPEAGSEAASRNLHVAMAALRRVLEPTAARGSFQLLRRDGDAYRLALPNGASVDLQAFDRALAAGRASRERGDDDGALRSYEEALDLYAGDLLPEDGPAEWVADRRELARLAAVEAAQRRAEILLRTGDPEGAARAANAGLRIDRYQDPLWRLLIKARDEAGDQGAASRARTGYDKMLSELGVETPAAT
jgi:DNA-binding SARP family transcriptional activator